MARKRSIPPLSGMSVGEFTSRVKGSGLYQVHTRYEYGDMFPTCIKRGRGYIVVGVVGAAKKKDLLSKGAGWINKYGAVLVAAP